jgi:acetyltransferase-like isoleucine patch superfamily enzyme
MHPLFEKFTRAVNARDLPVQALVRKVARNATALARATVVLRHLDHVGTRARVFGAVHVRSRGVIAAGDDLALGGRFGAVVLSCVEGATLMMGDRVTINYGSFIGAATEVVIDDDVMVGPYCVIADSEGTVARRYDNPVFIGANVWLAARVVVRPGAHIGAGAVIAAGSVVEGTIPPNAVASGCPARVLRIHRGFGDDRDGTDDDHSSVAKLPRR